jgi:hypothetical protein
VAIEYQIKGDFQVDSALEEALLGVLDESAEHFPPAADHIEFEIADAEVDVTGLTVPGRSLSALLSFRVRDKSRALEAIQKIVRALDAVLRATTGSLKFFVSSESLLLERARGEVRLIHHGPPRGDFWIDAHARLIHGPVTHARAARQGDTPRGRGRRR